MMNARILKAASAEIEEKKSRFIGEAFPVASAAEAQTIIERVTKQYWDARHHVYAYRVDGVEKASDDGEPARTAGVPILSVLQGQNLMNVLVVVTRYFGGTLLGTGGLVRAYTRAAQAAIAAAGVVVETSVIQTTISLPYPLLGKLQFVSQQNGWDIAETFYDENVTVRLVFAAEQGASFVREIREMTSGTIVPDLPAAQRAAKVDGQWQFFLTD